MKTAIFGGSFNPIHIGHLHIATQALKYLDIERVLFVPVGIHHFKNEDELTPYEIRAEWIKEAILPYPEFSFSDADAPQYGKSYTKNLFLRLQKQYPEDEFVFLAGADIVSSLGYWYDSEWLLDNVNFAIFTRPGVDKSEWDKLPFHHKFLFFEVEGLDVSSTQIRLLIKEGKGIEGLVSELTLSSIVEHFKFHN